MNHQKGISGLKLQSYVNFGIAGYDNSVASFLKSKNKDDGDNSFNRILEADQDQLLLYGGMDAMLEFRLAYTQMEQMKHYVR